MSEKAKYYKLKNGLSICLVKIPKASVVNMMLVTKTGFAFENSNTLGYSHLLEHILMDSHPNFTVKNAWEEIEQKGIYANASTDYEIVDYTYMGSTKHWKTMFEFVTVPITGIKITKKTFNREMKAVKQELKNYMDESLRDYKDTIKSSIYKDTILASTEKETLNNTMKCTMNGLEKFFEEQYVYHNMTLLIVGNFPERELRRQIAKLENPPIRQMLTSDAPLNKMVVTDDGQQVSDILETNHMKGYHVNKKVFVKSPKVEKVYCCLFFKLTTEPYSKDHYIAEFLSRILTDGMMSVLYKKLRVDKKWVYGVSSYISISTFDSDFSIKFNTESKHFKGCVDETFKSLAQLRKNVSKKIYSAGYEKIKTEYDMSRTSNIINKLTNHYEELIQYGMTGKNMLTVNQYYDNLLKVKAYEIKDFINRYIIKDNCRLFYGSKKNNGTQIKF